MLLQVKIKCGNEDERTFYVNDVLDIKRVQDNLLEDFQRVLADDKSEDKIKLERMLDKTPFDTMEEFEEWVDNLHNYDYWDLMDKIPELVELQDCLDSSDFGSIDEMTEKIDELQNAIEEIYYMANNVR